MNSCYYACQTHTIPGIAYMVHMCCMGTIMASWHRPGYPDELRQMSPEHQISAEYDMTSYSKYQLSMTSYSKYQLGMTSYRA